MDGRAGRKMPEFRDTCAVCGRPIEPPRRAYCSAECQRVANHQREHDTLINRRETEMSSEQIESIDEGELWAPIPGHVGEYEVSSYGRVRSVGFFRTTVDGKRYPVRPRLLKQQERKGYMHVALAKNGKYKRFRVHRLVASAFIDNPEGKPDVNHIDGNKANNHVENLEWVTPSENTAHAIEHGLASCNPLPMQDARRKPIVRDDGVLFSGISAAARAEGVPYEKISYRLKMGTILPETGHGYQYVEKMPSREDYSMELKVKLSDDTPLPYYAKPGDAGMDLTSRDSHVIRPGKVAMIDTGVSAEIPNGWFGMVVPRSGIASKRGLVPVNSPGTIDSGYRGTIMVPLINLSDETQTVLPGERIAQIIILKCERCDIVQVEQLTDSERGEGGFGSSGRM